MLDPRTADILARTLHVPAPDLRAVDRQLLHGPDEARVRVRPPLSIAFYDFWPEFNKARNFFTEILSSRFQLRAVQDDADLAVYSVFGTAHHTAKARRRPTAPRYRRHPSGTSAGMRLKRANSVPFFTKTPIRRGAMPFSIILTRGVGRFSGRGGSTLLGLPGGRAGN